MPWFKAFFLSIALGLLLLAGSLGCDPNTTPTPDGGTPPPLPDALPKLSFKPCDIAKKVGEFRVELTDKFTGVQGQVFDDVVPENIPVEVKAEGSCQLLRKPKLFCQPACTPGNACNADGKCIPYPTGQDLGTVAVHGLKEKVQMEGRKPIYYYTYTGSLPHPGFEPGAAISLQTAGGAFAPLLLQGWGIEGLKSQTKELEVQKGKALAIAWDPPSKEGPSSVQIKLDINAHGGGTHWIQCEAKDTGAFTVPEALITALFDEGVSGFPSVTLTRRSADSTDTKAGCVQLLVLSQLGIPVNIPGLTSCSGDSDCPNGQQCKKDLTCG